MTRVASTPCLAALAVCLLASGVPFDQAHAQNFGVTSPVGVLTIPLPAQSDTRVSIPLLRFSRYEGAVQAVNGNVVTVTVSPGWTANQFVRDAAANRHDTFFALLGPNAGANAPKEGCFYTVTGNGANTLTLDLNGDDLSTVQPGTRVTLIPYWTLGTAFPASDAGRAFVASASPSAWATVIFPTGVETVNRLGGVARGGPKPPAPLAYYFYAGAWRSSQDSSAVAHDDDVLYPDGHFIMRNTAATPLAFRPPGAVLTAKLAVPVPTPEDENTLLNCPVGLPRPFDVSLNSLGLVSSGVVQESSGDSVWVFGQGATGYNQAPVAEYFFSGGAWRKAGTSETQDFGATLLPAGAGWVIHKASGDGTTLFWQNVPNYSASN